MMDLLLTKRKFLMKYFRCFLVISFNKISNSLYFKYLTNVACFGYERSDLRIPSNKKISQIESLVIFALIISIIDIIVLFVNTEF